MTILFLLVLAQTPGEQTIWSSLTEVESLVTKLVAAEASQFEISTQNPVRGYYIERRGVVLMVPVRYRVNTRPQVEPVKGDQNNRVAEAEQLGRMEIQKRLEAWREEMRRQRILKEANFEKVVENLTEAIPRIVAELDRLPADEALTVIIEERLPTWYYPGFSLDKNPSTKVVTLTIDNREAITRVYSGRTELRSNWQEKIKRTNTDRSIVSLIP